VSKVNTSRKTYSVIASFALCSILVASLISMTMNQHALAQDLSSIKDKASELLNSQSGSNNTGGSVNNNTSTGDTGTSSLKDKASNAIGSLLK
jgi:hypothetical protein